jgi:hypothetical protein
MADSDDRRLARQRMRASLADCGHGLGPYADALPDRPVAVEVRQIAALSQALPTMRVCPIGSAPVTA